MLRAGVLRLRRQVEDDPSRPAHHPWPRARSRFALPPGDSDIGVPRDHGRERPPCGAGTSASECHEVLRWVRRWARAAATVGWSTAEVDEQERLTLQRTVGRQLGRATRWRDAPPLAWAGER